MIELAAVTPADVAATARAYLGVRFVHQGRSRAGMDCAGLVVRVAQDLGLSEFDWRGYGRLPEADRMREVMQSQCVELKPGTAPSLGLVALMRFEAEPQHLAIVVDHPHGLGVVHALMAERKVAEHRLDATWSQRIVALYELPGVQYGVDR